MDFMKDLLSGQGCDVNGVGRNPLAEAADRLLSTGGVSLSNNNMMMNDMDTSSYGIMSNSISTTANNDMNQYNQYNDMSMNQYNDMSMIGNNDMTMMNQYHNNHYNQPPNMMMLQYQQNMMMMQMQQQMQQMTMMQHMNQMASTSSSSSITSSGQQLPSEISTDLHDMIINAAANGELTPDILQQMIQQHGINSLTPDKEYIANKNVNSWAEERERNAIRSSIQNGASQEGYDQAWKGVTDKLQETKNSTIYEFINDNKYIQENETTTELSLFERAMIAFKEGNISDAIHMFEADVQKNNDRDESWRMLGLCHAENDDDKRAIVCLKRALEIDPYNLNSLLELGISYVNELDSIKALQTLKEWVTNNPRFQGLNIASDEYSDGTFMDEVIQLMIAVVNFAPNDTDAQIVLGVLYNVSQDFECAVESFTNATKTNSSDYTIYNKIGATLANGNRSLEAIPAYAKALEMRPRYARGWLNLGISYANINKYNEAAKAYLQALYLNPEAHHIWNYLRVVFTCMQRLDLVQETGQTLQGLSSDALKQHIKKVLSLIDVGYELIE